MNQSLVVVLDVSKAIDEEINLVRRANRYDLGVSHEEHLRWVVLLDLNFSLIRLLVSTMNLHMVSCLYGNRISSFIDIVKRFIEAALVTVVRGSVLN